MSIGTGMRMVASAIAVAVTLFASAATKAQSITIDQYGNNNDAGFTGVRAPTITSIQEGDGNAVIGGHVSVGGAFTNGQYGNDNVAAAINVKAPGSVTFDQSGSGNQAVLKNVTPPTPRQAMTHHR